MGNAVGVRFKAAGKLHYFDAADLELQVDDWALVETARGRELGRVVVGSQQIDVSQIEEPLKPVIRRAGPDDLRRTEANRLKIPEALAKCARKIEEHKLPMRLVDAEYNFDCSRLTFYFTSESRVDFRQLVRDLASIFRTRIELRQIGARDQASMVGGIGRCGLGLCCSTFLTDFGNVSMKMAKEQDLSLNPAKITGMCGRLLCCLGYEHQQYREMKQGVPRLNETVQTDMGPGRVTGVHVLKRSVDVVLETGGMTEVGLDDLRRPAVASAPTTPCCAKGGGCCGHRQG